MEIVIGQFPRLSTFCLLVTALQGARLPTHEHHSHLVHTKHAIINRHITNCGLQRGHGWLIHNRRCDETLRDFQRLATAVLSKSYLLFPSYYHGTSPRESFEASLKFPENTEMSRATSSSHSLSFPALILELRGVLPAGKHDALDNASTFFQNSPSESAEVSRKPLLVVHAQALACQHPGDS